MQLFSRPINSPGVSRSSLLMSALIVTVAADPQTEPFTDAATGITFQRFFGAKTGFGFSMALPENPSTDFIGRLEGPMPGGQGWAGVSLQDDMVDPLLIVAWPNGNQVVSSFRIAKNEDDSPPAVNGKFSIKEISQGTVANDTHMIFTFLCQQCLDNGKLSFSPQDTAGTFGMGWALADRPVSDASDPGATLPFHNVGFDEFDAVLSQARSPLFGEWAQLADPATVSNGSTTPIPVNPPGTSSGGTDGAGDDSDDADTDDEGGSGEDSGGGDDSDDDDD